MKKVLILAAIAALLNVTPISACEHIHDEECGYNPVTGEDCTHDCTDECAGVMPLDGGCAFCPD